MSKKTLDLTHLRNELEESVFFHPPPPLASQSPAPGRQPPDAKKDLSTEQIKALLESEILRQHDTTIPRNHDTVIPSTPDDLVEIVRAAVKPLGKEAATHRFTLEEKKALANIVYTYKTQGVRTSENEIARIGVNYLVEDYQRNGELSILAKVLRRLNS